MTECLCENKKERDGVRLRGCQRNERGQRVSRSDFFLSFIIKTNATGARHFIKILTCIVLCST